MNITRLHGKDEYIPFTKATNRSDPVMAPWSVPLCIPVHGLLFQLKISTKLLLQVIQDFHHNKLQNLALEFSSFVSKWVVETAERLSLHVLKYLSFTFLWRLMANSGKVLHHQLRRLL